MKKNIRIRCKRSIGIWAKKFFPISVVVSFLVITSAGCSLSQSKLSSLDTEIPVQNLFWPPPPQVPKVQHIKIIRSPGDIGIKQSWIEKALSILFGKEVDGKIILRPYGIYAESGRIYVTDPGMHILHVFDEKKKQYFMINTAKDTDLVSPIGVTVDMHGEIYLSDSILKRVFVFDKKGSCIREIGSPDSFTRPTGIALLGDRIYIVDTHSHRVLIYNKNNGDFLFSFGKNGTSHGDFNYPTHIFIGQDDLLYITDSMNFRVQVFDREGNFVSSFGKHGDGSGDFSKPKGIAVDSEGHIYVVDADFDVVQIFDRDGKLLLAFGSSGTEKGKLFLPAGVFIDEKDRIYVADSYNNRIQIFQYIKETTSVQNKN